MMAQRRSVEVSCGLVRHRVLLTVCISYPPLKNLSLMANNSNKDRNERSGRGFASMDEDKQREIASKGGQSQGKENNPGNFANDRERASEAGRKGGSA